MRLTLTARSSWLRNLLKAVEKNGRGQELLDLLEDSPANLMEVFHAWMEATSAGGSLALADLLDEHGDKIYPEVLRYYGVDLRGLFFV